MGNRRVTFVEALGRGGFGAVYLVDIEGRDSFVQRVAVKLLNDDLKNEADIVARQRDEARLLAQLNHDHIVKVFDLNEIHGRPAVFMEYVPGVDAGRLLQCGPLSPRAALEVAAATASALHAAWCTVSPVTDRPLHAIHRDIKPSNLLVSQNGMVKVLDFGIARADFDREGKTQSHQFGTARYIAPEQWLGSDIGPGVDVYALGITLVELLKGGGISRMPMLEERFPDARDALVDSIRDAHWGSVWWRELRDILVRMLAYQSVLRPTADEVQGHLLSLAEEIGGEGLARLARREIPILMARQRKQSKALPLFGSTHLYIPEDLDPSILTDSKIRLFETGASTSTWRMWVRTVLLVLGLVGGIIWMVTGIWPDPSAVVPPADGAVKTAESAVEMTPTPVQAIGMVREKTNPSRARPLQTSTSSVEGLSLTVVFDSQPQGAMVRVDGQELGRTPTRGLPLSLGPHRVEMMGSSQSSTHPFTIRESGPTRFIWLQAENDWASGY